MPSCDSLATRWIKTPYGTFKVCVHCLHRGHMIDREAQGTISEVGVRCQCEHICHTEPDPRD